MRIKSLTVMTVFLFLAACSGNKAPAISLDSKLKCEQLADSQSMGDDFAVNRQIETVFQAAAASYKGDSDVEYYFQNVLKGRSKPRKDVDQDIISQCLADTGRSLADVFRQTVKSSYDRHGRDVGLASCKASTDGLLPPNAEVNYLSSVIEERRAASVVGFIFKPGKEDLEAYRQEVEVACTASPERLVSRVAVALVDEKIREAQRAQHQREQQEQESEDERTLTSVAQINALLDASEPVSCQLLADVQSDRSYRTGDAVAEAVERAKSVVRRRSSPAYAAVFYGQAFDIGECAKEGLTLEQGVQAKYGPDTVENTKKLYFGDEMEMERAAASEMQLRKQIYGDQP